jgi:alpha-glucosidase
VKGRDGCRVPLPWTAAGPNFGFGGAPWLPQPDWFAALAADVQDGTAGSTLEMYRAALGWRRKLQAEESLEWLSEAAASVVRYRRPNGWEVLTNFGAAPAKLPAGVDLSKVVLSSGEPADGAIPAETTLWLAP